jgi:hypothetical protein
MDRSTGRTQVHPLPLFYRREALAPPRSGGRRVSQTNGSPNNDEKWTPYKAWNGMKSIFRGIIGFIALCITSVWKGVCWTCDKCWKKASELWRRLKAKKEELDRWNPDENHPLVQWIAESKLAGLKETVKKDRPILNR